MRWSSRGAPPAGRGARSMAGRWPCSGGAGDEPWPGGGGNGDRTERRRAWRRGRAAESLASWRLRLERLSHPRARPEVRPDPGEIDIVARQRPHNRLRRGQDPRRLGQCGRALPARQRRRIARAASAFLAARPQHADRQPPLRRDAGHPLALAAAHIGMLGGRILTPTWVVVDLSPRGGMGRGAAGGLGGAGGRAGGAGRGGAGRIWSSLRAMLLLAQLTLAPALASCSPRDIARRRCRYHGDRRLGGARPGPGRQRQPDHARHRGQL